MLYESEHEAVILNQDYTRRVVSNSGLELDFSPSHHCFKSTSERNPETKEPGFTSGETQRSASSSAYRAQNGPPTT